MSDRRNDLPGGETSALLMSDTLWLTETAFCRVEQLAEVSGLSRDEIDDLIDNGIIVPASEAVPASFTVNCIVTVKAARRLRDDFQLDRHGLTLALRLIQRVETLEDELRELRASGARHQRAG